MRVHYAFGLACRTGGENQPGEIAGRDLDRCRACGRALHQSIEAAAIFAELDVMQGAGISRRKARSHGRRRQQQAGPQGS